MAQLTETERDALHATYKQTWVGWRTACGECDAQVPVVSRIEAEAMSVARANQSDRIMALPHWGTYGQPSGKAVVTFYERDLRATRKTVSSESHAEMFDGDPTEAEDGTVSHLAKVVASDRAAERRRVLRVVDQRLRCWDVTMPWRAGWRSDTAVASLAPLATDILRDIRTALTERDRPSAQPKGDDCD